MKTDNVHERQAEGGQVHTLVISPLAGIVQPYYQDEYVTLYHGDCNKIIPLLNFKIDLILTDPPYGINHNSDYRRFSGKGSAKYAKAEMRKSHQKIYGDNKPFDPTWLLGHKNIILFGANCFSNHLPLGSWLVWDKRTTKGSTLLSDAEVAWWSRGHGVYIFEHCWSGFSRASENSQHYHPNQKPVALMKWCIGKALKQTGVILDPYAGSGSTLKAAKDLGHRVIGIEIEERYCEIAAKRLAQNILPLHDAI